MTQCGEAVKLSRGHDFSDIGYGCSSGIMGGKMRKPGVLSWSWQDDTIIILSCLYGTSHYGRWKAPVADVLAALDAIGTREAGEIRRSIRLSAYLKVHPGSSFDAAFSAVDAEPVVSCSIS